MKPNWVWVILIVPTAYGPAGEAVSIPYEAAYTLVYVTGEARWLNGASNKQLSMGEMRHK